MDSLATKNVLMIKAHNWKFPVANRAPRVKIDRIIAATLGPRKLNVTRVQGSVRNELIVENSHAQFIARIITFVSEEMEVAASKLGKA
jgi:hypothetical protein